MEKKEDKIDIIKNDAKDLEEISEYKSGKILYEEVLTGLLQQANASYVRNDFVEFCFTVQSIWNNLYERDRLYAIDEVKRIEISDKALGLADGLYASAPKVLKRVLFREMMYTNIGETGHLSIRQGLLSQWKHGSDWRRAYQILQETLREKYHGNYKRFTKDKLPKTGGVEV